jgi:hypothetical protein
MIKIYLACENDECVYSQIEAYIASHPEHEWIIEWSDEYTWVDGYASELYLLRVLRDIQNIIEASKR